MGRLSKHRKIKSCDPFFKGSKNNVKGSAKKEKKKVNSEIEVDLKEQRVPRKAKEIIKLSNGPFKKTRKKELKKSQSNSLRRLPWESKGEFFERVDEVTKEKLSDKMKETKKLRTKRKDHLKNRKDKLKKQKIGEDDESASKFKDHVKFGEVVQEPPLITVKPKKAHTKQGSRSSLLLENKLKSDEPESSKPKKRKNMSHAEKRLFDEQRQKAIEAYRLTKKRKMDLQSLQSE